MLYVQSLPDLPTGRQAADRSPIILTPPNLPLVRGGTKSPPCQGGPAPLYRKAFLKGAGEVEPFARLLVLSETGKGKIAFTVHIGMR